MEKNNDICKSDKSANPEQSVQENISEETDKTDDTVYNLHVQVDGGNEDANDIKNKVIEIIEEVICKIDDKEAKDDKDVENVTRDCEVGVECDK